MPAGNRTGPSGQGPMTGRGAGFCAGNAAQGFAAGGRGRGFSRCGNMYFRGGRGFRNRFFAVGVPFSRGVSNNDAPAESFRREDFSPDDEIRMLRDQAEFMKSEVEAISSRIKELESMSSAEK
jgi:hypothetical protein